MYDGDAADYQSLLSRSPANPRFETAEGHSDNVLSYFLHAGSLGHNAGALCSLNSPCCPLPAKFCPEPLKF